MLLLYVNRFATYPCMCSYLLTVNYRIKELNETVEDDNTFEEVAWNLEDLRRLILLKYS